MTVKNASLSETQRQALQTFAATGQMISDGRVVNALIRRQLVSRVGPSAYTLTDAGRAIVGSGSNRRFKARAPMTCIVDGCNAAVYGQYNMCGKHFERWLDGRLPPRSQMREAS